MKIIFKKEFNSFFSSITGYIVIALFVLANALFLWVLPGQWNVFDGGYASLDALFFLAPWLYLFLCPAVTMRFFAEEKSEGTIELLLTKPLSRLDLYYRQLFPAEPQGKPIPKKGNAKECSN